MIPADPSVSGNSDLIRHLTTLRDDFAKFDIAKQNDKSEADHIVSRDDLNAVVEEGNQSGRFSQADVEAAKFLLASPEAFARVDTAAVSDNHPFIYEYPDGKLGELDAQAALRDAEDFDGALTFHSQQPTVPEQGGNEAQQDAQLVLLTETNPLPGTLPHEQFNWFLHEHHDDAAYMHDFLGALGSDNAGRELYHAYASGGQSRDDARDALASLTNLGLLTNQDLDAAHFKTAPGSDSTFSLQTLLDADGIEKQVEDRRGKLGDAADPENTNVYDAYDALLTVESPENKKFIEDTAQKYGIDPALLAGTVAAEMDFDHTGTARIFDGIWRHTPIHVGQGPGIASVHHDTLTWAVDYMKQHGMSTADAADNFVKSDPGQKNAADFNNSVESAAIVLSVLQDARTSQGASVTTSQDMAMIWAAYRSGIKDFQPNGQGFSMDSYLHNHVDEPDATELAQTTGDPNSVVGGNAYQSQPYFEYLMRSYA